MLKNCKKIRLTIILSLIVALLFLNPIARAASAYPEYNVKAELIFRIAEFVDWPTSSINAEKPFIIGIYGENPFGNYIYERAKQEKIHNCKVRITEISNGEFNSGYHIIFVTGDESDKLKSLLKALSNKPVLIIGDLEDFTSIGTHLGFAIKNDKIRFNINIDAAKSSGLHFSSALLRLATKVYGVNQN